MQDLTPGRLGRLALACLALPLALAAPAAASPSQVSIIQDDFLLASDGDRETTLDAFAELGADWVHVVARWDRIAPDPDSGEPPAFDVGDPAAYPPTAWGELDAIVRGAEARGLAVLLTPSGPVPRWASLGRRGRLWKPNVRLFGRFVQALGLRYGGDYAAPGGDGPLPRVERWSVWNEPNQPGWLRPQFERGRPYSPHRYRLLYRSAVSALRRTGHGDDLILLGETAPLGDRRAGPESKMRPGRFLRELFCLGSREGSCRGSFERLPAGGLAHHPYVKFRNQTPRTRPLDRDDYPIGASPRLFALLDRAGRAGRVRRRLGVYFTELGWQSNPPDELFGVGLALQARYINESERMAYGWRRVRSTSQYLLNDEPDLAGFQTGLRFESGRPKPALAAYRVPLVLSRRGRRLRFWGLVRPAEPGVREAVRLLYSPGRGRRFRSAGILRTGDRGVFAAGRPLRHGRWRVRWTDALGRARYSRVAGSWEAAGRGTSKGRRGL